MPLIGWVAGQVEVVFWSLPLWRRGGPPPPQPELEQSRLVLGFEEELLVTDIGRDGHRLGVPLPHELRVDHHSADVHIGEEPSLAIALMGVELEANGLALHEPPVELGRLPRQRSGCRDAHADVADLLDPIADADLDHVGAEHADDDAGERGVGLRVTEGGDKEDRRR